MSASTKNSVQAGKNTGKPVGNRADLAPRVSVVMSAYNSPEYIPTAIESFLDQSLQDIEVIVVDDGSPHDIASLVAPYGDRVRMIRQDNAGPGAARDTGLAAARGEYVAFGDSDDIHLPFRLAGQAAVLDAYPKAAVVFSDFSTFVDGAVAHESSLRVRTLGVDESEFDGAISRAFGASVSAAELGLPVPEELLGSRIYHGRVPALIAGRHVAWEMASMFRKGPLISLGGHDRSLRYWEDWHVTSRIAQRFEMAFWDTPVLLYRQHGSQITAQGGVVSAQAYRDVVLSVWMRDAALAHEHPQLRKQLFRWALLNNARCATAEGEHRRARAEIVRFIRGAPLDRHGYSTLLRTLLTRILSR